MSPKRTGGRKCSTLSLLLYCMVSGSCAWSLTNVVLADAQEGLPLLESVASGLRLGLRACQSLFRWERWSCPSTHFREDNEPVTREAAFLASVRAAGVTFTISRNCSRGQLATCSCAETDAWHWRGCSSDVDYASRVTGQVLGAPRSAKDGRALLNFHNNQAGINGVRRSMERVCKCHGVSGSCTSKTCWPRLPTFNVVAAALKKQYRRAVKLEDTNAPAAAANSVFRQPEDAAPTLYSVPPHRLAYLADSPDYCRPNITSGWAGTGGRKCSRARGAGVTPEERRSCRRLCSQCGLAVIRSFTSVTSSCNCRFQWCCTVLCDTCTSKVATFACADGSTNS